MEDVDSVHVKALFNRILEPEPVVLHVPEFCVIECTNILWKRVRFSGMTVSTAQRTISNLITAPVIVHGAIDYLSRALEIGLNHQLAIYDAMFIVLAEMLNFPLITADAQQVRVARTIGIALKSIADFN